MNAWTTKFALKWLSFVFLALMFVTTVRANSANKEHVDRANLIKTMIKDLIEFA